MADVINLVCGISLGATDTFSACVNDARDQLRTSGEYEGEAKLRSLAQAPVYAAVIKNSASVGRRFPVVILEGSNSGRANDFMVLAEYLASWGYVVASLGEPGLASPPYDVARARHKADAVKESLRLLSSKAYADTDNVGAVAWSFGGAVVPIVARNDPRVRALVSLDSGFNYSYGGTILQGAIPDLASVRCQPLLHLLPAEGNNVPKDDSYVRSSGLTYRAVVPGFSHASFSDLRGVIAAFARGGEHWASFRPSYVTTVQAIRIFLDAYIKKDRSAARALGAVEIGGTPLQLSRHAQCL